MSTAFAVEAEELGKHYWVWGSDRARLIAALTLGRCRRARGVQALEGVSFQLRRGAALALVGANGAGKSTLLKLISGNTPPSAGRYRVTGRVASLLELGSGFHPDYSGRENVLMNGVLLGSSRREVRARMGEIFEFAGLEHVADAPVRTYSTGMAMRLAFASAMGLQPDILLLDEVLAVGDMAFQKRCVDRLFQFRAAGGTLLLASHSLYDLRQLCDEALWLEGGRVAGAGSVTEVTHDYAARTTEDDATREVMAPGVGAPRVTAFERVDVRGLGNRAASGDTLRLRIAWEDPRAERCPLNLGVTFTRDGGTLQAGIATHHDGMCLEGASGSIELEVPDLSLLAGTFTLIAHLMDEHGVHRFHERALATPLVVTHSGHDLGLVRLQHRWHEAPSLSLVNPARRSSPAALQQRAQA